MTTPDAGTPPQPGLLTVGHSNHHLETFFSLPAMDRVQLIVDVRSSPWSRFAPHFNRNSLQTSIRQRGLEYLHAGDRLGGRPSDPTLYTEDGQADYQAMAQDPGFQGALAALTELAAEGQTAILCSEREPQKCHRALLIADALDSQGVAVAHIVPGSPEPLPHAELLASLMESWKVQDPGEALRLQSRQNAYRHRPRK